jgi:Autotransporter beta-domain
MPANLDNGSPALGYTSRSSQANPLADFNAQAQPAVTGPNWAAWGQGFGDWERYSALNTFDLTHQTSLYGVQSGVDGTWLGVTPNGGALVAGVVGSWMSSNVNFNGTTTSLRLTGPGIGVYETYVQGNFSADLTTKFDFLQLNEDFGGGTPSNLLGLTNAGADEQRRERRVDPCLGAFPPPTLATECDERGSPPAFRHLDARGDRDDECQTS